MTCGNPTCKYEFCWICLNECSPVHFERVPCRGRQFVDVDSFSYQFKLNHPCCDSCLIKALKGIAYVIGFIIWVIALPGIGLSAL